MLIIKLILMIAALSFAAPNDRIAESQLEAVLTNSDAFDASADTEKVKLCVLVCRDTVSETCPYLQIQRAYRFDDVIAFTKDGAPIQTWGEACRDTTINDWNHWVPQIVTVRTKVYERILSDTTHVYKLVEADLTAAQRQNIKRKGKRWMKKLGNVRLERVKK